jgi:hypothetical protein
MVREREGGEEVNHCIKCSKRIADGTMTMCSWCAGNEGISSLNTRLQRTEAEITDLRAKLAAAEERATGAERERDRQG